MTYTPPEPNNIQFDLQQIYQPIYTSVSFDISRPTNNFLELKLDTDKFIKIRVR